MPCDCATPNGSGNHTTIYPTTVNPSRNNGNPGGTTPSLMSMITSTITGTGVAGGGSTTVNTNVGGCICAGSGISLGTSTTSSTVILGTNTNNNNNNNNSNEDGTLSNAETLLSSNARFQAISAIAVAQDGVINIADQGKSLATTLYRVCRFSTLSLSLIGF